MENLLREYLEQKFHERDVEIPSGPGPVVTLSREFGCPSKPIGQLLVEALNKRHGSGKNTKWRFINKEVVEESARELDLKPTEMNYMLSSGEKGILEDMLISFSANYVSNIKIKKTITRVIQNFADQGNMVLVGRGSAAILQDRKNTLNIRLFAPLSWRITEIMKLKNVDERTALKMAKEMDAKRTALIEMLLSHQIEPGLFDVHFNCGKISKEEIVHGIIGLMEARKMISRSGI